MFSEIRYRKGIGPRRAEALERVGVRTLYDLLTYYPRKHYDRGRISPIGRVRPGEAATVLGEIVDIRERRTSRKGMYLFELDLRDETGTLQALWFNQRHLRHLFHAGDRVLVTGPVSFYRGAQIQPAEFEILEDREAPRHAAGMVPAYTVPDGFSRKGFRELVHAVVDETADLVEEIVPEGIRKKRGLLERSAALRAIHFPADEPGHERARRRLAYEEFFLLETYLALRKRSERRERVGIPLKVGDGLHFRILSLFPFSPTRAQERVIGEIRNDLRREWPMNRLLQGDVGSGKTIVAAYALLAAIGNRAQAAIMAPTEILAEQHARTFRRLLDGKRVRIAFLGGGLGKAERAGVREGIEAGEVDLVIGTHAVIQKDVRFKNLALAVVDEQQKFGVLQRAELRRKGPRPHTLVMTATPIPRTLTLTTYGDLDLSVLDESPPGRKPVITLRKREVDVLEFARRKVREGRQAYFVYPLVNDSDKIAARSATAMTDRLRAAFPEFRIELLHGQQKPGEKDRVMESFRIGETQILVSTLVVEVGIDVPNASVMVIGNAERYGLAQLHQLRGRIGRGPYESYCLVLAEKAGEIGVERLRAFVSTTDGFRIAEADLRLRGPGEMFGTRQSGVPEFRAADPVKDLLLLGWARDDAFSLVERDPGLAGHPALREWIRLRYEAREALVRVG